MNVRRFHVSIGLPNLVVALAILGVCAPCAAALPPPEFGPPVIANTTYSEYQDGDYETNTEPAIATDGRGNWMAVWAWADGGYPLPPGVHHYRFDIRCARSIDGGRSWSEPVFVNVTDAAHGQYDRNPSITTDGNGTWVVVWHSFEPKMGGMGGIFYSRSTDFGMTWSPAVALRTYIVSAGIDTVQPMIVNDRYGTWLAVWFEVYQSETRVYVSRSTDARIWSAPEYFLSPSIWKFGDRSAAIVTDEKGNWILAWCGERVYATRSFDNGQTWSTPATVVSGLLYWGTQVGLATDKLGHWLLVWNQDPQPHEENIFFSRSDNNGATWTDPAAIASTANTYQGRAAVYPAIGTDGAGNWCVVMTSYAQDNYGEITISHSTDIGATWSLPVPPYPELGLAVAEYDSPTQPVIVADNNGNWAIVTAQILAPEYQHDLGDIVVWPCVAPAGLKIFKPNGGEALEIGAKYKIRWESTGFPGADVQLSLWRNGIFDRIIKNVTPNDGKQNFRVKRDLAPGDGYQIHIRSVPDGTVKDTSDVAFSIVTDK